eukprot:3842608-Amphidinium_carterae.1
MSHPEKGTLMIKLQDVAEFFFLRGLRSASHTESCRKWHATSTALGLACMLTQRMCWSRQVSQHLSTVSFCWSFARLQGGKPVIFHTISVLCEPGDEVIFPDPGFPAYEACIRFTGATPVPLKLHEENGFRFSHAELRKLVSPRTKLIIVCSPGNPTGGVLTQQDIDVVAEVAQESDAWVLSDEIYSQLIFQGRPDS